MRLSLFGTAVTIETEGAKLKVIFGYNKRLVAAIKAMGGARYHDETKNGKGRYWTIDPSTRNMIAIKILAGVDPYPEYKRPIVPAKCRRKGMEHQDEGLSYVLTRRRVILAFDPGTGKTLVGIEAIEQSGCKNPLWISTKNALASTRLELRKWGCAVMPTLINYDQLAKTVKEWPAGKPVFDAVILDEISRCKNPSTKRFQAAEHICNSVRTEHKHHMLLGMSGSCAPKDPTDWWALAELMSPGWLPEGSPSKLRNTVAFVRATEAGDARVFNKVIDWRDNPAKCQKCGLITEHHDVAYQLLNGIPADEHHTFVPSTNEVKRLGERLSPMVLVRTKDVLKDLPEQIFRTYVATPTPELKAAAALLAATAPTAIQALILMRELSDGFQYEKSVDPVATCICNGRESDPPCSHCHGSGVILREDRKLHKFPTAKDDAIQDLLEEFSDDSRVIIYAGFQASVDRLCELVRSQGWEYVRLDGRGITSSLGVKSVDEANLLFQSDDNRNIAWIGHPKAGGMGITLTKSKVIIYYSNDFDLESRLQSKDRNHRIGSKGSLIIDIIHLPVDQLVVDKLNKKQNLMRMSLGDLRAELELIGRE